MCSAIVLTAIVIAGGLSACSSTVTKPLPSGPPPEYEAPRDYKPQGNIDQSDAVPSATPSSSAIPAAPTTTPSAKP